MVISSCRVIDTLSRQREDRAVTRQLSGARSSPPFVGRERELASLTERLQRPQPGNVDVLLIAGEPGVGKTRLMEEAAAIARNSGRQVLVGHAYDSEGMPPYLPFTEALQDYLQLVSQDDLRRQLGAIAADIALLVPDLRVRMPDIPASVHSDPESDRYRLFESVRMFLVAIALTQDSGVLLCLEDLQWADDPTLLLLEHLARRPCETPVQVIVTYRPTEIHPSHPLARTLEQLTRLQVASTIHLKGLTSNQVAAVLAALGKPDPPRALVEAVWGETEGNPFFVREVFEQLSAESRLFDPDGTWVPGLRFGETDLPQSLRLVTTRRLERLSEACRGVLSTAAILGQGFSFELLRVLTGLTEEALLVELEEAERAHFLALDENGRISFAHELIRQTLLSGLSALRRQRLHLSAAKAIETLNADRLDLSSAALAEHYSRSGNDAVTLAKALHYAELAASRAMSLYAYSEAGRHFERALEIQTRLDQSNKAKRCDLLTALVHALMAAGQPLRAVEQEAEEAFTLAEALADSDRAANVCRLSLGALMTHGAISGLTGPLYNLWADRADRHAKPGDVARVHANIALSNALQVRGRLQEAHALRGRAIDLARKLGDRAALVRSVSSRLDLPVPPAAEREVLDLAREFAPFSPEGIDPVSYALLLESCALRLVEWGDRELAEPLWRKAAEIADLTNAPILTLRQHTHRIVIATLEGDLEEAIAAGDRLVTHSQEVGSALFGLQFAWSATRAFIDLGRAQEGLEQLRLYAQKVGLQAEDFPVYAILLARCNRRAEARDYLQRWLTNPAFDIEEAWAGRVYNLLETAVLVGDERAAATLAEPLRPLGDKLILDLLTKASVARLLGDTDVLLGRLQDARTSYERAIEICTKARSRPELAQSHLGLAELLLKNYPSERIDAFSHLDFAIAEFEAMKMLPALDRASRLRGRPRPAAAKPRPFPDGLTPREGEVLRLIAAGRTNREISGELVLSVRTVARHITNIYTKIGARSKAEATGYAMRQGLT